jgi:hypothetical protein
MPAAGFDDAYFPERTSSSWLYAIAALSLFSGLLGSGHHYYWIGTPGYTADDEPLPGSRTVAIISLRRAT